MRHASLDAYLATPAAKAKTPLGVLFVEDGVALERSVEHLMASGFAAPLLMMPDDMALPPALEEACHRVHWTLAHGEPPAVTMNALMDGLVDGRWVHYCHSAEFLFFPFSGTRRVGEFTTFVTEERRESVLCFVVDLYAGDTAGAPDGVALDDAWFDRSGYYALARSGSDGPRERQLDFFGGLRWRFEEHIPQDRRRIDRVALFRARKGRRLLPDHTFEEDELNTYACPWHNSPTAAIASFRTAKALRTNPGSRSDVHQFRWHGSEQFTWTSRQLMEHGLMEPGQWF